jgi:hypothetical protein
VTLNHIAAAVAIAAICGNLVAACSTTYQPRPSGRVGFVIHRGTAMYVKNGQEFAVGPLGGALEPLVASSPTAAALAHRARNQLTAGVPLYVGGVAAVVIGLVLSGGSAPWIARGAGAASAGTGLVLIGAGFTNAVDAVNVYNDWVSTPVDSR